MSDSFLSYADFKARTIMPSADVDRVAFFGWRKKASDTLASDATSEAPIGQPGETIVVDGQISFAVLIPHGDAFADPSNFATFTLSKRTNGGPATTLATLDTSSSTLSANLPMSFPLATSPALVSAGDMLTIQIAKAGAGVVLPIISVIVAPTPNWVDVMLMGWSDQIRSRLRKRYSIPQTPPYPETIPRWLTKLGTRECYARRGWNPTSAQDQASIEDAAETASKELAEAANSETGLFDLALRDDLQGSSGISQGGPFSYSEASPYTWIYRQVQAVRNGG